MPNRNAFIAIIDTFKATSPAITKEQRIGLLRQATQQYGLSFEDAEQLLKSSGLVVGDVVNYFEVLELSVEELQNQTEAEIATRVDTAYHKHYRASLIAGARPGEAERRTTLNEARKILKDAEKRREHIATLQPERESTPMPYERMPGPRTPSTKGPKSYSVEQKLDAILLVIKRGYSGVEAARTLDPPTTSSTVNTWVRQFTGRYRSGDPMLVDRRIPAWVEEARQLHRQRSGQGDSSHSASVPTGMVLIPAGEFLMGSDDGWNNNEQPVHTVYVDAFYMDVYEVTNAQYKRFVDANPQWQKDNIPDKYHDGDYLWHWNGNSYPSGQGNHPVVWVSWYTAMAYAQWAGKRLPTEAEWEKAARGGLAGQKYPWGNDIDTPKANYDKEIEIGDTTPVGSYAPNGYGLYDMAGNVWEWCVDAYERDFYARSARQNPIAGKRVGNDFAHVPTHPSRVLRGGSWNIPAQGLRVANRDSFTPTSTDEDLGFRCARDITP